MNKKDRKRKSAQQWIGILIYLLIGGISGILILQYMEQFMDQGVSAGRLLILFGCLLLSIYLAMLIQIVIHEAGHLVFGLLTGYHFNSFRIFGFMLLKEQGKLRLRHLSLAGTGGQCLMDPPDLVDGRIPVLLYNFGGAIMNLIASAVFLGLFFLVPRTSPFSVFLELLIMVGIAFAIMNGVPLHLGAVDNDGCNAISLLHSKEALRAFWIQMKANVLTSRGIRMRDMPEEWFAVPDDASMKNSMTATVGLLACNRLLDQHRFEEADALMEHLLSIDSGIVDLHRYLVTCDRIFVELIGQNRKDAVEGMLTKEQQKFMKAMRSFPSVLRTEYVLALFAGEGDGKGDRKEDRKGERTGEHKGESKGERKGKLNGDGAMAELEKLKKQFEKISTTYPYPSEIEGERELIQIAEERCKSRD